MSLSKETIIKTFGSELMYYRWRAACIRAVTIGGKCKSPPSATAKDKRANTTTKENKS